MSPRLSLFFALLLLGGITAVVDRANVQWDLTLDQRYTLNEATKASLKEIKQPLSIDVLIGGELPSDYQRLRTELTLILDQFQAENDFIQYVFVDPFEEAESKEKLLQDLYRYGLMPELEVDQESQSTEQTIVVPWMILNSNEQSVRVSLLQKNFNLNNEDNLNLEKIISGTAIASIYNLRTGNTISSEKIFEKFIKNDADAVFVINGFLKSLAETLSDLSLTYSSGNGILLAGSLIRSLCPYIDKKAFIENFMANKYQSHKKMLELVSIGVITKERTPLYGNLGFYKNLNKI